MSESKKTIVVNVESDVKCKVTKTSYEKIVKNIDSTWPEWKKKLCNQELLVSVKSKKI